ncbi:hypothetical protein HDV01_002854 [Terramyces sp. JEL0728]|nr:hypothetical protein HDV01_002854 [Terramyces sp. JEL0728]
MLKAIQKTAVARIPTSFQLLKLPSITTPHMISQPHPISNIRMLQPSFRHPYLEMRRDSLLKHHLFWKENNKRFQTELQSHLEKLEHPTSHDYSEFYRQFSERNHSRMVEYNKELWKENFKMLIPGVQYELAAAKEMIRGYQKLVKERIRMVLWFIAGIFTPLLLSK